MLDGYSVHRAGREKDTWATEPRWHYSSNCLAIEYWADPVAVAALLPPGLTPDDRSAGRVFLWFNNAPFSRPNDARIATGCDQYGEAFVLLEALFDGAPVNFCPYIFVDHDAAIACGGAGSFPKNLGNVHPVRIFSAQSPPTAPLARGTRFGASVVARGERLATARVQMDRKIENPSTVFNRSTTIRGCVARRAVDRQDNAAIEELALSLTDNLALVDVWTGSAELTIPELPGEELHAIAPRRVGRGYRLGIAYSVTDLAILKNEAAQHRCRGRRP